MPRYVAFLRGVSPTNAKMPELKRCFEEAGFLNVKTILSSGNVIFDASKLSNKTLENKAQAEMTKHLGRSFRTIVRPTEYLQEMLASDPFSAFTLPPQAKRVVTFFPAAPQSKLALPVDCNGAQILNVIGTEAFSAYVVHPRGPVFMTLIARSFGADQTTRTWGTVMKCAVA
jgi:uncharacterized protein (DUF1697 family)